MYATPNVKPPMRRVFAAGRIEPRNPCAQGHKGPFVYDAAYSAWMVRLAAETGVLLLHDNFGECRSLPLAHRASGRTEGVMSTHTPGPWETDGEWVDTRPEEPTDMRTCFVAPGLTEEEIEANAYILAAAPDLLAHLREAVEMFDSESPDDYRTPDPALVWAWFNRARAAIAKATGGAS